MAIPNFFRGDTKQYKFTFTDAVGVKINITGWKLYFTLKSDLNFTDAQSELQVSTTAGSVGDDDPVNGIMNIILPSDKTKVLVPGLFHYDIERIIASVPPDVATIEKGKLKILEDVTITDV